MNLFIFLFNSNCLKSRSLENSQSVCSALTVTGTSPEFSDFCGNNYKFNTCLNKELCYFYNQYKVGDIGSGEMV